MIKSFLVPVAAVFAMAGCAADLVKVREGWYGATYEDVVRAWGKPSSSGKSVDGGDEHVWIAESPSTGSTSSIGVGFGIFRGSGNVGVGAGTGVSIPTGQPLPPTRCERRLTFRDSVVVDQVWNGDPEYCRIYRRPG